MERAEIDEARRVIEKVRPDSWWGPGADLSIEAGDLRLLIYFLELLLRERSKAAQCSFDLGEDWG